MFSGVMLTAMIILTIFAFYFIRKLALKLKNLAKNDIKIKVFRNSNYKNFSLIDSTDLVPGDIFQIGCYLNLIIFNFKFFFYKKIQKTKFKCLVMRL